MEREREKLPCNFNIHTSSRPSNYGLFMALSSASLMLLLLVEWVKEVVNRGAVCQSSVIKSLGLKFCAYETVNNDRIWKQTLVR